MNSDKYDEIWQTLRSWLHSCSLFHLNEWKFVLVLLFINLLNARFIFTSIRLWEISHTPPLSLDSSKSLVSWWLALAYAITHIYLVIGLLQLQIRILNRLQNFYIFLENYFQAEFAQWKLDGGVGQWPST